MPFHFAHLKKEQAELVKTWLKLDYVSPYWYGAGLENTLQAIDRFVRGKEKLFTLWIAYDGETPFGFLMTSDIEYGENIPHTKYMQKGARATSLDLLIGNKEYLGKGLAHQMILDFLSQHFPKEVDVFIDPGTNNAKAIHVYQKAGFVPLEEFIPEWDPTHPCLLMQKKGKCND